MRFGSLPLAVTASAVNAELSPKEKALRRGLYLVCGFKHVEVEECPLDEVAYLPEEGNSLPIIRSGSKKCRLQTDARVQVPEEEARANKFACITGCRAASV